MNLHNHELIFHGANSGPLWLVVYRMALLLFNPLEPETDKSLTLTSCPRGGYTSSVVTSSSRLDSRTIEDWRRGLQITVRMHDHRGCIAMSFQECSFLYTALAIC
jgi:hypothetical protein